MKAWKTMLSGRRCWSLRVGRAFRDKETATFNQRRSAMDMRVMLIGLLVIGSVAMLETDVSASRPCDGWPWCYCLNELKELVENVKKDEKIRVWIIGETDDDRQSRRRADVRQTLIQYGLRSEIIGELIYKDPELREECMRKDQMVIVTGPEPLPK
jgi:hypothetical protein